MKKWEPLSSYEIVMLILIALQIAAIIWGINVITTQP